MKVCNYKFLGQTITTENRTRQKVSIRLRAGRSVLGKQTLLKIFPDRHLPTGLKGKVFSQSVLPTMKYGYQTWSLTAAFVKKSETDQRPMGRKMLNVKRKRSEKPSLGEELK